MKLLRTLFLVLIFAACRPLPAPISPTPTETLADPAYPPQCAYVWARQELPELSAQVQQAFDEAGMTGVTARAGAYGENCVDAQGKVVSFSTMETDFYVTAEVTDLTDNENLGNILEDVLIVLDKFPAEKTPGPQPGYIGITFQAGDQAMHLWFTETQGIQARRQGLHGAALLKALRP
ncbi:MAG: hypothetical protein Q8N45_09065 [Anaerolineales bacterium]|nr:hypothetical protein [Anaerolineales bacterium]